MQLTTFKENFEVYDGEKLWFKSDNIDEVKSVIENTFKDASITYKEYKEAREVEYIDSKGSVSSFHESFLIELCATIKDLSGTRDIWIINFFKSIKQRKYISQLATKDFVRAKINQVGAEIAEVKSELIRWVLGIGVASVLVAVSANFAMMTFFFQQLTK
ncbi:hypothetical protein LS72_009515 [Helicobacter apodemus]|uniref:Uncharacterized protein n=1 Tax=Helicobacter apodemus TaxID=135569 RepID=A0A4U8UDG2_9HELI|nr:hypothetical protein [Helicobacter apodemus]TLE13774.1 hypothetical protein LS72_009515 [Helicobacter apodemus]